MDKNRHLETEPSNKLSHAIKDPENAPQAAQMAEEDPNKKDKFGATPRLRNLIDQKYELVSVLGKGSYGCVSKGRCKKTGRIVAVKIMENQTDTEYDTIKLVRELKILLRLKNI